MGSNREKYNIVIAILEILTIFGTLKNVHQISHFRAYLISTLVANVFKIYMSDISIFKEKGCFLTLAFDKN